MNPKKSVRFLQMFFFFLICACPAKTVAASFVDVHSDHPYNEAITYVEKTGIVSGYPDHTYHPDETINRAEFIKIIVGATLSKENIDSCSMGGDLLTGYIKDIPSDQWYTPYVCAALLAEYAYGYPDGTFRPDQSINFVEATKILSNAYRFRPTDDKEIWYRPFVMALAERSAIPMSITSFDQKITRGEMAEMVMRLRTSTIDRRSRTYQELAGEKVLSPTTNTLHISFKDGARETQMVFSQNNGPEISRDLPLMRPIFYIDPQTYTHGELAVFYYQDKANRVWYALVREGGTVYVDISVQEMRAQNPCLSGMWHIAMGTLEQDTTITVDGYDRTDATIIPPRCS